MLLVDNLVMKDIKNAEDVPSRVVFAAFQLQPFGYGSIRLAT
jgi:hypothetical protein